MNLETFQYPNDSNMALYLERIKKFCKEIGIEPTALVCVRFIVSALESKLL